MTARLPHTPVVRRTARGARARVAACALCAASTPQVGRGQDAAGRVARVQKHEALPDRLDAYPRRLAAFGYTGNVLVAQGDRVLFAGGYGLANAERKVPFGSNTAAPLGSIVKMFTEAAILALASEGRLSTTDSLGKFFPGVPRDKAAITLQHVLRHTAGFPVMLRSEPGGTREQFVSRILAAPLDFEPGTRASYSNPGYGVLAAVVEGVTGEDYEAFLRRRFFVPAGMHRTGWRYPAWNRDSVAGALPGPGADVPWGHRGAGGFLSTPGDMHRWHLALLRGRALPPDAVTKLGWMQQPRLIAAGGDAASVEAAVGRRERDTLTVYVVNMTPGGASRIARALFAAYDGDSVALPPAVRTLPAAQLARYAGVYPLPAGGRLRVSVRGRGLDVHAEGQEAVDLVTQADGATRARRDAANARTDSIIRASFRGDWEPLRRALGDGGPVAEVAKFHGGVRERFRQRYGPFRGYTVLGTRPLGGSAALTQVRFAYERGSMVQLWEWDDDSVIGAFMIRDAPTAAYFLPAEPGAFVSWDPFAQKSGAIHFSRAADGSVAIVLGGSAVPRKPGGSTPPAEPRRNPPLGEPT